MKTNHFHGIGDTMVVVFACHPHCIQIQILWKNAYRSPLLFNLLALASYAFVFLFRLKEKICKNTPQIRENLVALQQKEDQKQKMMLEN